MFPLTPGDKIPLPQTRGHLDASTDPAQVDRWWHHNPNYNIGIAVAPSGLVVLDVDVGTKKDGTPKRGYESLTEIERELTPTLMAQTGRGGIHAVYTRPEGLPAQRVIGFKDGLDLIGEGYIVAAPSYNAETGGYYQWTHQQALSPLPPFLQHVARAPKTQKVDALGAPIVEGGRNNALYRLGAALRDTGIGREALARALDAENRQRFSPPVSDSELLTIVDSIMTRVEVKRDVAAGAVVAQEIQEIFAPTCEQWIDQVAAVPQPPVQLYSTGFATLDKLTRGGFRTRQLCGLIAPPSTGKSALIGSWLLKLEKYRPVLHCSLELLMHELFVRYAAEVMGFPWADGVLGKVDQAAMAAAIKGKRIKLMGADEFDRLDPYGSLEAAVERMTAECGIAPIIAIDYVQLMARGVTQEMRHKVGELSFRARKLAQKFDTVVLAVFTTARTMYNTQAVEKMRSAQDPTAYLGAAKESGDIEFDCATLMYLDVEKLHEGPTKPAQIAVARCRQGDVGFVGLRAQLDVGRFHEDPSCVAEFASEARAAKRAADTEHSIAEAIMTVIREMPGRGWGEIQREVTKRTRVRGGKAVDEVRETLVKSGHLEKTKAYDPETKKELPRGFTCRILKELGTAESAPVSPQEEAGHEDAE